jgi:uncharacterized membrane protein
VKIEKYLPHVLTASGLVGVLASAALVVEEINLLKNPAQQLGCDLNPIIACGSVINTGQAAVFGFPNPLLGVAGFGGLLAIGLALFAGAKFGKWFWQFMLAGLLFAAALVHWLIFQTIYSIGALCPFCMVVWVVTITSFWYVLVYSLRKKNLKVPSRLKKVSVFAQKHHLDVLIIWFLVVIGLILNHFWYYWKTLV